MIRYKSISPKSGRGVVEVKTGSTRAFTIIEIMIVLTIIALLASIATPSMMRARQRSVAGEIKEEVRHIEMALTQLAIENPSAAGQPVDFDQLVPYFKPGSRLASCDNKDRFGNDFNDGAAYDVDTIPKVASTTISSLQASVATDFWAPYY